MSVPQVVNLRAVDLRDPDVVRIDRRTAWGNPFVVGIDGDRATVIEAYRQWIKGRPELLELLGELDGKRLACWCPPRACHGDVLAQLVAERAEVVEEPEAVVRACPRCDSRYGMAPAAVVCSNCARDLKRAGEPVAEPGPVPPDPVDPEAEGWAWLLTPCGQCGRPSLWPVCSHCRGRQVLEESPPGPVVAPVVRLEVVRECGTCGEDTGRPGFRFCLGCATRARGAPVSNGCPGARQTRD